VAEALIAAATLSGGIEAGFHATKKLGVNLPGIETWEDLKGVVIRPEQVLSPFPRKQHHKLEKIVQYTFRNKGLLALAMVRSLNLPVSPGQG
jgi:hypothetical protein